MEIRLTGQWNKLRQVTKNLAISLEKNVRVGVIVSAYSIKDNWVNRAIELELPDEYIESIDVIPRRDGAYVGPIKEYAMTPTGPREFEKIRVGEVISYITRCPVNKYYREVKRTKRPEKELKRYIMPDIIESSLEIYKDIIRENVKEKILELIK